MEPNENGRIGGGGCRGNELRRRRRQSEKGQLNITRLPWRAWLVESLVWDQIKMNTPKGWSQEMGCYLDNVEAAEMVNATSDPSSSLHHS